MSAKEQLLLNLKKIETNIGSLKFAVSMMIIFAICMIAGTFCESYFGTEFATKAIYKTWWFMLVQFFIAASILFAATLRLPPKKRLYGFYTVHTGLLILFTGSAVTYISGTDGQVTLTKNETAKTIALNEDIIRIRYPKFNNVITYNLPYSAFSSNLNDRYDDIVIKKYFPFAENTQSWAPSKNTGDEFLSGQYYIYNNFISQEFALSLNPEASDFDSTLSLGPLTAHFLPKGLAPCFLRNSPSQIMFWDQSTKGCFTLEEKGLKINQTASKKKFISFKSGGQVITFFPELSPWALTPDLKPIADFPIRIFNAEIFSKKPTLFLFGEQYIVRENDKWVEKSFDASNEADLPWMGFKVKKIKVSSTEYPINIPHYETPIQKNNQMIKGNLKAAQIEYKGKDYWLTSDKPLILENENVVIEITKKVVPLPFEATLTAFKMDKDPGTDNPASYESFVRILSSDGPSEQHIYMNHPYKNKGLTFYQASYFEDNNGDYGSVLSANIDPGRPLKYAGSLLLVFGAIWHYIIRRKILSTTVSGNNK